MKLSYDFERYEPPRLTEQKLEVILQKRREVRRMIIFAAASNLFLISLALLALALAPYSMLASVICLAFLGIYLSASGILTVLLTRRLIDRYGKSSAVPFALNT